MSIDPLPTPPSASDAANFETRADAFNAALAVFAGQVNAALQALNSPSNARIVDVVVTSNISIAGGGGALINGTTVDGVVLTTGMRALLVAQSTGSQNGIYDVPASGAASRSVDSNSSALFPSGLQIAVTRGTNYANSRWSHATAPGFTLGTTALTITQYDEFVSSSASGVSLTNSTNANITSISLTPGEWDIAGTIQFAPSGSASSFSAGIGTVSATLPAFSTGGLIETSAAFTSGLGNNLPFSPIKLVLTVTTTVYLVGEASFPSGTCTAAGYLRARRIK